MSLHYSQHLYENKLKNDTCFLHTIVNLGFAFARSLSQSLDTLNA